MQPHPVDQVAKGRTCISSNEIYKDMQSQEANIFLQLGPVEGDWSMK